MSKKMSIEEANELVKLQEKANGAYAELDERTEQLFKKYGDSVHVFENDDKDKPWLKVVLEDNIEKLKNGGFFKASAVKPVRLETRAQKSKPTEKLN